MGIKNQKPLPTDIGWQRLGTSSRHGINVPLFSLRSENSQGIGEFFDLILMIDWLASCGFSILQILPIYDTGRSSSPYNALSSCALNPVYLHIPALEGASSTPGFFESQTILKNTNRSPRAIYRKVREEKLAFLERYFEQFIGDLNVQEKIARFLNQHPWAEHYALFLALKEKNRETCWQSWSKEERELDNLPQLKKKHQKRFSFYIFLQILCKEQMEIVKQHAESRHVFLKGDIPILLSPDSADVWAEREHFRLEYGTGCPPDLFNDAGQNWGFPLFDWNYVQKTGYSWWKRRLAYASRFFHMYRIDHLVGFFRIWAIPLGKAPTEGLFLSKNRKLWPFEGKKRLEALIRASPMLPIAEDLGIMPKEASSILQDLGISGTRVTRWMKYWDEDGSFIPGKEFDPMSVTTLSTHDTASFGQWWEETPEEAKHYACSRNLPYAQRLSPNLREAFLEDAHASASIFHSNLITEYLALFPTLAFKTSKEERINVPGVESDRNWSLRVRATVETLSSHAPLCQLLTKLARL